MKKVFALFMCAVMLFTFTACGSIIESGTEEERENTKATSETDAVSDGKDESGELPVSGIEGDYKFDEYSDRVVLTEYIGNAANVRIPDMIKGKPVIKFGTIFKGDLNIKSVFVGKYCMKIVDNAFENCYNLQRVEIVSGVKSIGEFAFFGCQSLRLMYIPACVEEIADNAFLYSTDLIIYGDKGSAIDMFAEKYASIYFRDIREVQEDETLAAVDTTEATEPVTEQN